MDLLTVLTCARGKSYLDNTLASLERGGASSVDHRCVLVDGSDAVTPPAGWRHVALSRAPSGSLNAMFSAFRFALAYGADRLLYFEDDVVVCRNAIPRMLEVDVGDLAFVSFFDMKEMPASAPHGLHRMSPMGRDGRGFWGAQSMSIPRRTLEFALACEPRIRRFGNKQSGETLLGYELLKAGYEYGIHVPNLVEHVGDVSAIWSWTPSVNRRSTSFPGEHFDARDL